LYAAENQRRRGVAGRLLADGCPIELMEPHVKVIARQFRCFSCFSRSLRP